MNKSVKTHLQMYNFVLINAEFEMHLGVGIHRVILCPFAVRPSRLSLSSQFSAELNLL
jgi:hypothetical protein